MNEKVPYTKPSLKIDDQIRLLKERGLSFEDEERARAVLERIHYSRLRPYWHPFELDHKTHTFQKDATFDQILFLYEFDRQLRLLILEAIERFEVALRTQWAYQMAVKYGPFGYFEKKEIYRIPEWYTRDLERLKEEWERSWHEDPVFKNFREKYSEELPPVWLVCEVMSFGTLSRWFSNLGDDEVSQAIAALFGLPHSYLKGATRHLVAVRNYAAHHARVWDRVFSVNSLPALRKRPVSLKQSLESPHPQKIYRTLTLLIYLMQRLAPQDNWGQRLLGLLPRQTFYLKRMGFPEDYRERPVWKTVQGGWPGWYRQP